MLHRTISAANCCVAQSATRLQSGDFVMLNAISRWFGLMLAPTARLLAEMPPSAVRQIIFSL
jgi:hypothetical protein